MAFSPLYVAQAQSNTPSGQHVRCLISNYAYIFLRCFLYTMYRKLQYYLYKP